MKRLFFILSAVIIAFTACTKNANKSQESLSTGDLQGKYEVDLKPLMEEELAGEDAMTKAVAMYMISEMHMTFDFQGDKLTIDASDMIRGLVNSFSKSGKMPAVFDYKITNDSILSTREEGEDWKVMGVIRKTDDGLLWVTPKDSDDEKQVILTLRKVD